MGREVGGLQTFLCREVGTTVISAMFLDGNSWTRSPVSLTWLPSSVSAQQILVGLGLPPMGVFFLASASSVAGICLIPQSSLGWFNTSLTMLSWVVSVSEEGQARSRLKAELQLIEVGPESSAAVSICPPSHLALVGWQLEGSRSPC